MGGLFGVASRTDCVFDLFSRYGLSFRIREPAGAVWRCMERKVLSRAIHNIENSPFRTKFERDRGNAR